MKFRKLGSVYYFSEYLLLRGVAAFINFFPVKVSGWMAEKVGDLLFLVMAKRRRVVFSNLEIVFHNSRSKLEKNKIARAAFRNFSVSLAEFFRIPKIIQTAKKNFRFKNIERMEQGFSKGKGVIWVVSHLGAWEHLTFLPYLKNWSISVVGKPIKNPYINRWVLSLRHATGLKSLENKKSIRAILSALHKNHLVAILIDQWAGGDGIWVDFFGEPTSTTSIPVRLAKRTGAALIPAYCVRKGFGQYEIQIKEEVSIEGNEDNWEEQTTLKLNHLLEKQILAYPEQWLWTHRRWKGYERYKELKSGSKLGMNPKMVRNFN